MQQSGVVMSKVSYVFGRIMALLLFLQGPAAMTQPPPPPPVSDIRASALPTAHQLTQFPPRSGDGTGSHLNEPTTISVQPGNEASQEQFVSILLLPFGLGEEQLSASERAALYAVLAQTQATMTIVAEALGLAQSPRWLACSSGAVLCGLRASPLCSGCSACLSTTVGGGLLVSVSSSTPPTQALLIAGGIISLVAGALKALGACVDSSSMANGPADLIASTLVAIVKAHEGRGDRGRSGHLSEDRD